MKSSLPFFLLLALLATACSETPSTATEESPLIAQPTPLDATFAAHGGLDRWRSSGSLVFEMVYERGETVRTERILTDLQSRHERINGENYTLGFDGTNYWEQLPEGMESKNPQFQINLQFYFFSLPFVLADPGVNLEKLPNRTLAGQEYAVVRATFEDSVGVAPEDQYVLYLDPASQQLRYLLYSVTYFDASRAESYNAAHYADWQEVNGLLVPRVMDSYVWDNEKGELGESRGRKTFTQVVFGPARPGAKNFQQR